MTLDQQHWADRLAALAERHDVPGASLAILSGDEVTTAAYGVLNRRTAVTATPDSLFQIGSITKVFTATLVMQLVDDGLLDLDEPIVTYLPAFRVADDVVTEQVSTRHLLAHTSGIDGDLFVSTGRGDDCIEKYVEACVALRQTHPIGATMSYCNSGYVVLGRLVEVLRGQPWHHVLRERLTAPLGLTTPTVLAEEAILHRAAVGHIGPAGRLDVVPVWDLPRATSPAGGLNATAADVIEFVRLHLRDGLAADGTRILSAASAAAMRQPQVEVPNPYDLGSHWGLGWILTTWDGRSVYGHDGSTLGQGALLRVCPEAGVAVCLTANGGRVRDLYHDLFPEIFAETGVQMPPRLEPASPPPDLDLQTYAGSFAREGYQVSVEPKDDRLIIHTKVTGSLEAALAGQQQPPFEAFPLTPGVFAMKQPESTSWLAAVFYRGGDGSDYLHIGARANPRLGTDG